MDSLLNSFQFVYSRSDGWEIGNNTNSTSGFYIGLGGIPYQYKGVLLSTIPELPDVNVEISNLHVYALNKIDKPQPDFSLNAVIKNGATVINKIKLEDFTPIAPDATYKYSELKLSIKPMR